MAEKKLKDEIIEAISKLYGLPPEALKNNREIDQQFEAFARTFDTELDKMAAKLINGDVLQAPRGLFADDNA